jgi:hypothetical protein
MLSCHDLLTGKEICYTMSDNYLTDYSVFGFRSFTFKMVGDIKFNFKLKFSIYKIKEIFFFFHYLYSATGIYISNHIEHNYICDKLNFILPTSHPTCFVSSSYIFRRMHYNIHKTFQIISDQTSENIAKYTPEDVQQTDVAK